MADKKEEYNPIKGAVEGIFGLFTVAVIIVGGVMLFRHLVPPGGWRDPSKVTVRCNVKFTVDKSRDFRTDDPEKRRVVYDRQQVFTRTLSEFRIHYRDGDSTGTYHAFSVNGLTYKGTFTDEYRDEDGKMLYTQGRFEILFSPDGRVAVGELYQQDKDNNDGTRWEMTIYAI